MTRLVRLAALAPLLFAGACVSTPGLQAGLQPGSSEGTVAGSRLQRGAASFYRHGRRTASGEPFNPNAMTAAHPSLPFGTRVRVVYEHTGQSVVVRINDRGPHGRGRIIDLAYAPARALGITGLGVGAVALYEAD